MPRTYGRRELGKPGLQEGGQRGWSWGPGLRSRARAAAARGGPVSEAVLRSTVGEEESSLTLPFGPALGLFRDG